MLVMRLPPRVPCSTDVVPGGGGGGGGFWAMQTDGRDYASMMMCVREHYTWALLDIGHLRLDTYRVTMYDIETPWLLNIVDLMREHPLWLDDGPPVHVAPAVLLDSNTVMARVSIRIPVCPLPRTCANNIDMVYFFRYMKISMRVSFFDHMLCRRSRLEPVVVESLVPKFPSFDKRALERCELFPIHVADQHAVATIGLCANDVLAVRYDRYFQTVEHELDLNLLLLSMAQSNNNHHRPPNFMHSVARRTGGVVVVETMDWRWHIFIDHLRQSADTPTVVVVDTEARGNAYKSVPNTTVVNAATCTLRHYSSAARVVFDHVVPDMAMVFDAPTADNISIVWTLMDTRSNLFDRLAAVFAPYDHPTLTNRPDLFRQAVTEMTTFGTLPTILCKLLTQNLFL